MTVPSCRAVKVQGTRGCVRDTTVQASCVSASLLKLQTSPVDATLMWPCSAECCAASRASQQPVEVSMVLVAEKPAAEPLPGTCRCPEPLSVLSEPSG